MLVKTLSVGGLGILAMVITTAFYPSILQGSQSAQQEKQFQVPVKVSQLASEDHAIPVELQCQDAELAAPSELKNLKCVIRNNSSKNIIAFAVKFSFTLNDGEKEWSDSGYIAIDTFIHPDLHEKSGNKSITPGAECPVQSLPAKYDNASIREISLQIDYIEFEGGRTLGSNRAGARIVTNIREGAAKYKDWLTDQYNRSGKSANKIASLLGQDQLEPGEIGIENGEQEQGAFFYRNYARKTYESQGVEGLLRHLHKTSPTNK
jgi:hypothetical protein